MSDKDDAVISDIAELAENPEETFILVMMLALAFSEELPTLDLDLLGRLLILLGQGMVVLAILRVDRNTLEKMLNHQTTDDKIAELQRELAALEMQNKHILEMLWAMEELHASR